MIEAIRNSSVYTHSRCRRRRHSLTCRWTIAVKFAFRTRLYSRQNTENTFCGTRVTVASSSRNRLDCRRTQHIIICYVLYYTLVICGKKKKCSIR